MCFCFVFLSLHSGAGVACESCLCLQVQVHLWHSPLTSFCSKGIASSIFSSFPFTTTNRNLITYVTLNLTMESDQRISDSSELNSQGSCCPVNLFHTCLYAPQTKTWCYVVWQLVCFYIEWFYS